MSKYVFLEDIGSHYLPGEFTELEDSKVDDSIDKKIIHKISKFAEELIILIQGEGDIAVISKDVHLKELIEPEDIESMVNQNLATPESAKRTKINGLVNSIIRKQLAGDNQMHLFQFNVLNTWFSSQGIFITSENRQEQYIKIIELDNPEMLNNLEKLLESEKHLSKMYKVYTSSMTLLDDIKYLMTVPEIEKRYEQYITE